MRNECNKDVGLLIKSHINPPGEAVFAKNATMPEGHKQRDAGGMLHPKTSRPLALVTICPMGPMGSNGSVARRN